MRIDPDDRIAGHPILAIRNLLRKRVFDPKAVRKALKVDEREAGRVIDALKAESYICNLFDENAPPDVWQTTPKGSVLAGAHARPPITRNEAERIMDEFMTRIKTVRDDDKFLYEVRQVIVFGSYLRDVDELNDIDLIVKLRVKEKFKDNYRDVLRDRLEAAQAIGLRLKRGVDWRPYPRRGVLRYLQAISRYLSPHREKELEIIEDGNRRMGWSDPVPPHKVLYEAED
jgi:predicted nucleotidyltransferase